MLVIVGIILVFGAIVVGFSMAGGNLVLLIQISEFVIILGVAIGSMLIMAPLSIVKKVISSVPKIFGSHGYSKQDYMDLLKSFFDLFLVAQRDGLLAIEKHIEKPEESEILSTNKKFLSNKKAVSFFCDTLKVMLSGGVPPHDIEELMDMEVETLEKENKPVPTVITKVADAFPGIGIVAAVLGIIVTMASINQGAEAVGHHVAAALVGTFLGVLLSYGLFNPIATNIEHMLENDVRYLETIKACISAYAKGNPPIVAVEIARRTIFSDERPSFTELESFIRGKKNE
ncbi:MAG: flagellar motor stator protein MotA [Ignavibacteriales bacterium]|nr:MAG: flagellar motor stator protein MotA [Ignavibacteriales bacterium]